MWTQDFDLHSHSTHSDGLHEIELVAQKMKDADVKVWSLTDHDTISGWNRARIAAQERGIRFIPGVEITCLPGLQADGKELERLDRERAAKSWHLLAYFPNFEDSSDGSQEFQSWLQPLQDGRLPRMTKMVEKLCQLGMPISLDSVLEKASGSVGRPHLAEVMVEKGYVESKGEAFELWIGDGLPAHVVQLIPTIAEATKMVHESGGFVSLAHPLYYGISPEVLIEFCSSVGVDSIEAFHGSHPDSYRYDLWRIAKQYGMTITCGSDFHGSDHGHRPGFMAVPKNDLSPKLYSSSK